MTIFLSLGLYLDSFSLSNFEFLFKEFPYIMTGEVRFDLREFAVTGFITVFLIFFQVSEI